MFKCDFNSLKIYKSLLYLDVLYYTLLYIAVDCTYLINMYVRFTSSTIFMKLSICSENSVILMLVSDLVLSMSVGILIYDF